MIDYKQINQQPLQNNANSLINGRSPSKAKASFANELAALRQEAAQSRTEPNPMANEVQQTASQTTKEASSLKPQTSDSPKVAEAETELKHLRKQEFHKEISQNQNLEESQKESQELANKFGNSEALNAHVGQGNQKQITEAFREGNLAEQETQYQDSSNERKRQLANWEELAPSIIEDPMNKAIRLDIPGIEDVETLIVRMNKNGVGIQVVGAKGAMEQLMATESELAKRLRAHSLGLDKFQTFDGEALRKAKAGVA